jgi:hypothetical protein
MCPDENANLQGRQPENPAASEGGVDKETDDHGTRSFAIKIDRVIFEVHERELTGLQLRHLPHPPIGPDRDLFEVIPGGSDKKILDSDIVKMRDGLRFFTAPAQINPGSGNWG